MSIVHYSLIQIHTFTTAHTVHNALLCVLYTEGRWGADHHRHLHVGQHFQRQRSIGCPRKLPLLSMALNPGRTFFVASWDDARLFCRNFRSQLIVFKCRPPPRWPLPPAAGGPLGSCLRTPYAAVHGGVMAASPCPRGAGFRSYRYIADSRLPFAFKAE